MRSSLTRGSAIVASFALVAAGLAATPAAADDGTVTKIGPGQIAPVENPQTYNTWHQGNAAATSGTYSFTADGLRLRGKNQIMTGDANLAIEEVTDLVDGFKVRASGVESGELWYQLPLFYGEGDAFTTLRKDVTDAGSDWTSSRAIVDGEGATLIAKNGSATLAEIAAAISKAGDGDVRPLGYGVYTDTGSDVVVNSVEIDGQQTTFGAEAGASTDHVSVGGIKRAPETAENYDSWHQGNWDPAKTGTHSFTADGLKLSGGVNQILKGDKDRFAQISVDTLIDSIKVVSDADTDELFHQVPLYYGPTEHAAAAKDEQFTTLRKDVTESDALWTSSRAIYNKDGSVALAGNVATPLATVVAAIESASATYASETYAPSVDVIGYGVYSNKGSVVVKSVEVWGETTTFGAAVPEASAVSVAHGDIASSETKENYNTWHQGHWEPAETGTIALSPEGATLSGGINQLLKGDAERFAELSIEAIIGSVKVDVTDAQEGELYHQVPLYYGPTQHAADPKDEQFTTLRKDVTESGDAWISSRAIYNKDGSVALAGSVAKPLAEVVKAIESASATYASDTYAPSVDVIGYGVYSGASATVVVSKLTVWGVTYDFRQGPAADAAVTISGEAAVGNTLTATASEVEGSEPTFVWSKDGVAIEGATSATLELTTDLVGAQISVTATYPAGIYAETIVSDAVVVAKGVLPAVSIKVSGTAVVDDTLTANATKVDGATVTYAWSADGKAISGATASKLKLTPSLVGKKVSVVATYTHPAYVTGKATSAAVTVATAKLANPKVAVSGILKVTRTLSAKATWATKAEKVTYQWYADSKAIKGATKSSLKLTPSFIGKKITVTVTGTRAGYTTAKTRSSRTASVPKIDSKLSVSVPTGTKKITGTVSIKVKVNPTGAESVKGAVVLKIGKAKVKTTVTKAGTFTVKVPASKIGVATNPTMRVSYTPDSKTSKHTSKGHVVVKSSLKVRR